jgi:hypothetical protein
VKTTNPKDFIELLEVFHIALSNGLIDKKEIIKWADQIITQDIEPDYFIIELSLCGQKTTNDIISLLSEYIGEEKPKTSGRVILGFLYRKYLAKQTTLKSVVSTIYWITWKTELPDEEKSFMYGLDDAYDCATEGIYGTIQAVENETLRFLEIYKDFNIDNFEDWKILDKTIESKIKVLSDIVKQENEEFLRTQTSKTKRKWWKPW